MLPGSPCIISSVDAIVKIGGETGRGGKGEADQGGGREYLELVTRTVMSIYEL